MQPADPGRVDRAKRYALAGGLFVATLVVYSGVADHEFVNFDDLREVVRNERLAREVTPLSLLRHFWEPLRGNWLPIYWISLHLSQAIHGPDAGAFLLTNVVIHALASVALFAAFARMTGALGASAFVAGVFALHPLHVESVAWVTERKDVLGGLFWMLGLWAYAGWAREPSRWRYAGVSLCLVLGLLSKAFVVTFPFVLLLLDDWPLRRLRGQWRARIIEKLPLFALALVVTAVTYWIHEGAGNMRMGTALGPTARLVNAVQSYVHYLADAFWPSGLAAMYPHPFSLRAPTSADVLGAVGLALALVGGTGLVLLAGARRRYLTVGWLWYLGTLVPMIGLVHVGVMARADRYMYMPLVGLAIAVAWGVADLAGTSRLRRQVATVVGVAALVAMSAASFVQVDYWKDSVTLFERAIAVTGPNHFARENLATILADQGRDEESARHFEEAVRIDPGRSLSWFGLAFVSKRLGRNEAAIDAYRKGVALAPRKVRAHASLGILLVEAGRFEEALPHLEYAVRVLPDEVAYREALDRARSGIATPAPPPRSPGP